MNRNTLIKIRQRIGQAKPLVMFRRDSDGDGVLNVYDCNPKNPNQQGITHFLAEKVVNRMPEGERKRRLLRKIEENRWHDRELKSIRKEARDEERKKLIQKQARERVRSQARAREKYRHPLSSFERRGAGFGIFGFGLASAMERKPVVRRRKSRRRKK